MKTKKKVLIFVRSFLAKYFSELKSDLLEPIFVTLTHQETVFLESKGWKVYGCFEDDYSSLHVSQFAGNYLRTSLQSDRFLNRYPHEKRMEILGKEISFWGQILDRTNPDFLVNETVAIEIAEVMAIEANKRGIPFYTYLLGFFPNTFYWKPDPFTGRLGNLVNIIPSDADRKLAEEYVSNVIEKNVRPFYVSNVYKKRISIKTLLHSWLSTHIARRKQAIKEKGQSFVYEDYSLFKDLELQIVKANVINRIQYDDISTLEGKKIVFLPMHLEPEATLSYFVADNYDQSMLIAQVLKCIKSDQFLVVKEHPQQQGMLQTDKYKTLKEKNSNLIYFPSYVLSFPIIKHCNAIVTLTSTVAWEGLMLGKPVFVLGGIFYDQCFGAKRIESFQQLKRELQKESYEIPNKKTTIEYAAKMISLFHKGCPSPCYQGGSTLDEIVNAIENL